MRAEIYAGAFSARTNSDCKRMIIEGPKNFGLDLTVDYDDVNHDEVREQVHTLLTILNERWPLAPIVIPHEH